MRYNLDSALVVVLREAIPWESAVVATAGTLSAVNPDAPLDPLAYQRRDRELAFRDLVTAAAIVETSVLVSDVWNYPAIKPRLQGPVIKDLPAIDPGQLNVQSGNASVVRHVQNSSLPIDAARYADADLYGRDCLIYETLAQACQETFADPPISRIDSHGTIFSSYGTQAWSLAEGTPARADLNEALSLNVAAFKQPDQNLADRDNQLAGYAARLVRTLKNPFEQAFRIYVQVSGPNSREAEVYSLISDDGDQRVWSCEPALSLRNRIIYDLRDKTLQWVRERETEIHTPQIVALAVPGIDPGQTVTTLAAVPDPKDAQYWRSKAGQIKPPGAALVDTGSDLTFTADAAVTDGGIIQPDSASLAVPGGITFSLPGSLPAGQFRVSVLVQPDSKVTVLGNQNTTDTSGADGGASFGTNYAASPVTIPTGLQYRVIGGDGIVYNGHTYLAGQTFAASSAANTFTYAGAVHSKVNQYGLGFQLALPPGPWTVELGYTNRNGDTDGFGILGQFVGQGQFPVDAVQDAAKQPFVLGNGTVAYTPPAGFDIPFLNPGSVPPFNFPVYWTYGDAGQLAIQSLTFRSTLVQSSGSYVFDAGLGGRPATAYMTAEHRLPEILRFSFTLASPLASPTLTLNWRNTAALNDQDKYVPLKLKQVQVQQVGTYAATPLADEFQGWRQECLERAEAAIQQGWSASVVAYGTNLPSLPTAGWSASDTEDWMAFVETANPRLREVPDIPDTDALVEGRQYEVTSGSVVYAGVTYAVGDRFYATEAGGTDYSGGAVKQIGAFVKSRAGHVGKPALIPLGLLFTSYGTVAAHYPMASACPVIATCQPWMVDIGVYVAQAEFWMPETI